MNAIELARYHRPHRRNRAGSQWAWYSSDYYGSAQALLPHVVYESVRDTAEDPDEIGNVEALFDSEGDAMAALCVALVTLTKKGVLS